MPDQRRIAEVDGADLVQVKNKWRMDTGIMIGGKWSMQRNNNNITGGMDLGLQVADRNSQEEILLLLIDIIDVLSIGYGPVMTTRNTHPRNALSRSSALFCCKVDVLG